MQLKTGPESPSEGNTSNIRKSPAKQPLVDVQNHRNFNPPSKNSIIADHNFDFNRLPNEILLRILFHTDGRTQLATEATNRRFKILVQLTQKGQTELNVQKEYNFSNKPVNFRDFTGRVLRRYPNLVALNLSGTPIYLDESNLNQLIRRYPLLRALNIAQQHAHPKLADDLLVHLDRFRHLDQICVDRIPLTVCHDGVKRPLLQPTEILLNRLKHFSLLCNSGYLFRLLLVMKTEMRIQMANLETLCLGNRSWVTLGDNDFALIIWFIDKARNTLKEVWLQDLCFHSEQDAVSLLRHLLSIPHLRKIRLHSCTVRSLSMTFLEDQLLEPADCGLTEVVVRSSDQIFSRAFRKVFANSRQLDTKMIYPDGLELSSSTLRLL